jgi:DNA-directed RNA polymerase specialized sigma24 family protein
LDSDDLLQYHQDHNHEIEVASNSLHLFVLDYLSNFGPLSLDQLVADIGTDRQAANGIVDYLLMAGFLSGRDRQDSWDISPRGRTLLERVLGTEGNEPSKEVEEGMSIRSISPELWERARQALVFYFSRRLGMAGAGPEDLAQDTLVALWSREDFRLEKEDDFLRICYGFAKRIMFASYRQAMKHSEPGPNTAVQEQSAPPMHNPELKVFLDEVITAGKARLSEREWDILLQAAESERPPLGGLGLDEKTARVVLHRARRKLARLVGWQTRQRSR